MLFCNSFTHSARSLHTDLFITRLRRVVAEPDHTHTTWCFFTRERHVEVPTVHISPFCVIHMNIPTVNLDVHISFMTSMYLQLQFCDVTLWTCVETCDRKSLSDIRWTEEQINQYDKIALEDHSYIATPMERARRTRIENTAWWRCKRNFGRKHTDSSYTTNKTTKRPTCRRTWRI